MSKSHWNHIILEGFCGRLWEYRKKHSKYVYGWEGNKNPEDRGKKPNPDYDPDFKKPKRPDFCTKKICYGCLENNCLHLAYGEGRIKDVIRFNKWNGK